MIITDIENLGTYAGCHGLFTEAFDYIMKTCRDYPAPGEYEIDGRAVYSLVQQYHTMPAEACGWEGHRKYIDIHVICAGEERHQVALLKGSGEDLPYDPAWDVAHCEPETYFEIPLRSGDVAIYFPNDLHKAKCILEDSTEVKKVVVKVRL